MRGPCSAHTWSARVPQVPLSLSLPSSVSPFVQQVLSQNWICLIPPSPAQTVLETVDARQSLSSWLCAKPQCTSVTAGTSLCSRQISSAAKNSQQFVICEGIQPDQQGLGGTVHELLAHLLRKVPVSPARTQTSVACSDGASVCSRTTSLCCNGGHIPQSAQGH